VRRLAAARLSASAGGPGVRLRLALALLRLLAEDALELGGVDDHLGALREEVLLPLAVLAPLLLG